MRQNFALGTFTQLEDGPFACRFVAARALCSDGVVRAVSFRSNSGVADTFFSVPCSMTVKHKRVSGYITTETVEGWSTPSEDDPAVIKFIAYEYGKNANILPKGAFKPDTNKEPIAA